ncbi:hypothetical protein MHYP_G00210010 [Metynnis hypsauchen]
MHHSECKCKTSPVWLSQNQPKQTREVLPQSLSTPAATAASTFCSSEDLLENVQSPVF